MKAITARYVGPTSTKPSRVMASTDDGHRAIVPYNAQTPEDHHGGPYIRAVRALCTPMKWTGHVIQGGLKAGVEVFIFLPHDLELAHKGRACSEVIHVGGECATCEQAGGKFWAYTGGADRG